MRQLWKVEIGRTIVVEAETEAEAEKIARRYESQETMNEPDSFVTSPVTDRHQIPGIWHGAIPYCGRTDKTCAQLLSPPDNSEGSP